MWFLVILIFLVFAALVYVGVTVDYTLKFVQVPDEASQVISFMIELQKFLAGRL